MPRSEPYPGGTSVRWIVCVLAALTPVVAAVGQDVPLAQKYLLSALKDRRRAPPALAALRATGDRDLVPLFVALTRRTGQPGQIMGIAGLAQLGGPQAIEALHNMARKDRSVRARTQALAELLAMGAANTKLLLELTGSPADDAILAAATRPMHKGVMPGAAADLEGVRLVAARELVIRGRRREAAPSLEKLAASADPRNAAMARMSLLGLGRAEHHGPLAKILRDPATPARTVELLLGQIAEEKIAAAMDLAGEIAASRDRVDRFRLVAYRAVAAGAGGTAKLLEAIAKSDRTVFRVYLFRILIKAEAKPDQWASLAKGAGAVAALARFELARPRGGKVATRAAAGAVAQGHPVVVVHVLNRAKEDVESAGPAADWYTPVLLDLIRDVPARRGPAQWEGKAAGRAATLLGDLGTPKALAGLKALLGGAKRERKLMVAGGLLTTDNRTAALLAKPLLDSPYTSLSTTASLVLGRFAEPAAAKRLAAVVRNPQRHRPQVVTMACWYLLKIHKHARPCVEQLVRVVKRPM